MSVDRSLRTKSSLARHRNVLSRAERVAKLVDEGKWSEDRSPLGLPKVPHRKPRAGKKKATKESAEGAATPAAG